LAAIVDVVGNRMFSIKFREKRMPRKRIQIAKLLDPGLEHDFASLFYEELDSAFTAGIACCENCYDDFVRQWPGIYRENTGFQQSGIDLMNFYENSDFALEFTPEEFKDRVRMQVRCERCSAPLTSWFWPYTLPVDPPDNFEKDTHEIAAIAAETPWPLVASSALPPSFRKRVCCRRPARSSCVHQVFSTSDYSFHGL
jgi:hypothetical protein